MCLYDYFKSALVNVFIQDSLEDLARAVRFKKCLKSSVVTDEECGRCWFNEPDVVCVCVYLRIHEGVFGKLGNWFMVK